AVAAAEIMREPRAGVLHDVDAIAVDADGIVVLTREAKEVHEPVTAAVQRIPEMNVGHHEQPLLPDRRDHRDDSPAGSGRYFTIPEMRTSVSLSMRSLSVSRCMSCSSRSRMRRLMCCSISNANVGSRRILSRSPPGSMTSSFVSPFARTVAALGSDSRSDISPK